MDMQTTPDHPIDPIDTGRAEPAALSPVLSRCLHRALAAAIPAGPADSEATREENRQVAQQLFDSFAPRDPADALLAAIAVAAALAAMDGFARGARPGISDQTAARLRSSALAAGRTYAATLRDLRRRQPAAEPPTPASAPTPRPAAPRPAPTPRPAAQPEPDVPPDVPEVPPGFIALRPGAVPIPAVDTFQPRDRFGQPIPDWRTDLMTRAQVLASLTVPRDPKLDAAALAEEEAMIAEQAAIDAAARGGSG
jgi:hypothetical protein